MGDVILQFNVYLMEARLVIAALVQPLFYKIVFKDVLITLIHGTSKFFNFIEVVLVKCW